MVSVYLAINNSEFKKQFDLALLQVATQISKLESEN